MSRNGSGTYSLPKPPFVPNTTISSADVNSDFSDIAAALTASIAADGQTPITGTLKFLSGTIALPSHTFAADVTTGMYYPGANKLGFSAGAVGAITLDTSRIGAGQDGAILTYTNGAVIRPVGEIATYGGGSAPSGWFLCYGQAVNRTSYPELFVAIGTTFGSGDGTTTFNLPDLRGRVSYGKDDMGGTPAGRITTGGSGLAGTTLGAGGGSQNFSISTANLPPYTPTGTNTTPTVNVTNGGSLVQASPGSKWAGGGAEGVNIGVTAALSGPPVFTGTAQGGISTPIPNISPGLVLNKMIFAGRP